MRPPKANAARARSGAAKEVGKEVNAAFIAQPAPDTTSSFGGGNRLIARLDHARRRIDKATDLLQWSLDIREQLHWQIDADDARATVDAFKRDCRAWQRSPYAEAAS